MLELDYIEAFLSEVEGPCQTVGYIPCFIKGGSANYRGGPNPEKYQAMHNSGVTIATGCDLGQTDAAYLRSYGLASDIISIFEPYFGKSRDAAIRALHISPLVISTSNAQATDFAVHKGYLQRFTIPAYEKDSGVKFISQPPQAQAVIASLCFNMGAGGARKKAPITWKALCARDWRKASAELISGFSGQLKGRRAAEGRLLKELFRGQS